MLMPYPLSQCPSLSPAPSQGDRVVVGGEHFFRFNHPLEVERGASSQGQGGFEFARNELIRAQTAR